MDTIARTIFSFSSHNEIRIVLQNMSTKDLHMLLRDIYCRGFVILYGDNQSVPFKGSDITESHAYEIGAAMLRAGIKVHTQEFDIDIFEHILECSMNNRIDSGISCDVLRRASMLLIPFSSIHEYLPLEDYSMTISIMDKIHMIRFSLVHRS
jgi:hypothetical protein